MLPADRLICTFLGNLPVGKTFKDWPLHVTVIPWFRTAVTSQALSRHIKQKLIPMVPFPLLVDGEAGFGYKGRKLVNLIAQPSPLDDIEREARNILHEHGAWIVDETTMQRRVFRPHVTAHKSGRAHEGDVYTCDALYIIEQKGDYKEIVSTILL